MSDEKQMARRGGCVTFLLALAAFVMSGLALYQINQNDIEDRFREVAASIQKISEKIGDVSSISDARSSISDALSSLLVDENREAAADSVQDSLDRLSDYIDSLSGKEDADEELLAELESLQADGQATIEKLGDANADATEDVRRLFHEFKSLDQKINGE